MTFAQTWMRQTLGAAGASLLAPLAIVVAAGLLLAGGGLGGLSELGQITSGPTLPGTELGQGVELSDADIVGADLSTAPAGAAGPSAGVVAAPGIPGLASPIPADQVPSPLVNIPSGPRVGGPPDETVTPSPVQPPGPTPAGGPVRQLLDGTRGVVPEPIHPVTQNLINLLLGPPQR